MLSEPLVSVVIITYNTAEFVEKAIASVLSQTYNNYELIVVDDGSTDDTKQRLTDRSEIVYLNVENGGRSWARNHGIDISRGEWIAFLDADDIWNPEKLMRQMQAIQCLNSDRLGIVCTDYNCIDLDGSLLKPCGTRIGYPLFTECGFGLSDIFVSSIRIDNADVYFGIDLNVLIHGNCFLPSTAIIRKKVFENNGGFKLVFCEDTEAFLRWAVDWDFAFIDEPLVGFRRNRPGQGTAFEKLENLIINDLQLRMEFFQQHAKQFDQKVVDAVFSEIIARRSIFQIVRGDLAGARKSLYEAKAKGGLRRKFYLLNIILKLPNSLVLLLLKIHQVFKDQNL